MRAQRPFGAPQGFCQRFFTFRIFCVKLVVKLGDWMHLEIK